MARYRAGIETPWTQQAAFDYLSDFSTSAEWDPGVLQAQRIGDGPVRVGAEFRLLTQFLGRQTPLTYRVVEYDRPNAVTFLGENATVVSRDRITFEATPGGTRVSYHADLRLRGMLRLADPLLALAFNRVGGRALSGLRRVLEGPAPGLSAPAAPPDPSAQRSGASRR